MSVAQIDPSRRVKVVPVQIQNGQSLSDKAIPLEGFSIAGIHIPQAFTGTIVTFMAARKEDGDYFPVVLDTAGTEVQLTVAANQWVTVATATVAEALKGLLFVKVRTGTNAAPSAQAGGTITVYVILALKF